MAKLKVDDTLLEAAILGLQLKGLLIDEKIAELQGRLGKQGKSAVTTEGSLPARKRRRMSKEARAKIAAAQRKRWARRKSSG
jgi:hypothetical protein